MAALTLVEFIAGLVMLVAGAGWLVRGGSAVAAAAGVSPLIVGLTIVAYGTSAPEMAVSVRASLNGAAAVSVGNAVGSNIFNILFILGLSALILPLAVDRALLRRDVWVMIGASVLAPLLAWNGGIDRIEGATLLLGAVLYTFWLVRQARREPVQDSGRSKKPLRLGAGGAFIVGGLVALVLGARWLVDSATTLARAWGVSELVIGLTVVAVGTSLPEVATSIVAAVRGERDIAVGNVVGSNIFNILAVLGVAAASAPNGIVVDAAAMQFDIPVMIAASVACLPIFYTRGCIDRWEGAFFLIGYIVYVSWLWLHASQAQARHAFGDAMIWFVLPLAALTLVASLLRNSRRRSRGSG